MKVFWALVGGLMIAGGALVVVRSGGGAAGGRAAPKIPSSAGADSVTSTASASVGTTGTGGSVVKNDSGVPSGIATPTTTPARPSTPPTTPTTSAEQGSAAVNGPTGDVKPAGVQGGLVGGDEKKIEEAAELARKAMEKSLDEMLGTAGGSVGLEGAVTRPEVKKDEAGAGGGGAGVSADLRDTVVTRGDGSKLIDGRFVVRGKGTEAEPYRVPWEMLASVQETYSPRKGLKKIPERIKFLDGKWVKLSGFIAFPITSNDPKGLLVMLNQWDGCCIGVPPTPYDSVEVYLADRATAAQRASSQGSVYGRLKVDPLEDDGWVLGVYVIQGARLVTEE